MVVEGIHKNYRNLLDLSERLEMLKSLDLYLYYIAQAEEVSVMETINLTPEQYNAICSSPLDDYIFLSGKGGYDDGNHRQVVALKCAGKPTLYVDPSGSGYCRYMGVEL